MPEDLREAVIAIEDERFYKHKGVDYSAIVRAGVKNLRSGKNVEGGSTITQQLVRALYIKDPERNFTRKIREAKLASELEKKHSKTWILKNYLNDVPFGTVGGRTAIGAEAAAETFFDKHAKDLAAARGGAAGRAAPGARRSTTRSATPPPPSRAATRCWRRWPRTGFITTAQAEEASSKRLGLKRGTPLHPPPGALLLRLRAGEADRGVRRGRLPPRRPEGLHHDQPRAPGRRPQGDPGPAAQPGGPQRRDRLDRPRQRLHPGDGVQRHVQGPPLQPGRAGPPPARLGVQDDGADDRHPQGGRPQPHHLHVQAAEPQPPRLRPVEGEDLRQHLRRLHEPGARHAGLGQHRVRAADHRRRAQGGARDGQDDGDRDQARRPAGRGPRRPSPGRLPAGDGQRLRHARVRRHPQRAEGDPEGGVPRRQDRRPRQAQAQARVHRRPGLRGHQDPEAERDRAAPARARRSAARRPARRAPPTPSTTPGSWATRPSWPPRAGSATPTRSSRCPAWPAAPSPPASGTTT